MAISWVRRRAVTSTLVVCTLGLAACGGPSGQAEGNSGDNYTLRIGTTTGLLSINPAKDNTGSSSIIRELAYEPLIKISRHGDEEPGLAKSWGYVGTGSTKFKLHLRKNVRFSDGTKLTADAVKAYLDYVVKANGSATGLLDVKSVSAVDNFTVLIVLNEPNPILPELLSVESPWGAIASPKAVKKPALLSENTYGAGPYTLVPSETVQGDHYVYKANPKYYDKKDVHFRKIIVTVMQNQNSLLQAIKTGQVDVAEGDPETAEAAKSAGLNVSTQPLGSAGLILMDRAGKSAKPLGEVKVRRAMNYAIDRDAITAGLFGEYAKPTSEKFNIDSYDPSYSDYYPYKPKRAKELLAQAGYPDGFTLKVLSPPKSSGTVGEPMVRAIAKYLKQVGINLDITVASTRSDNLNGISSGKYPAIGWSSEGSQKWLTYQYIYPKKAFFNVFQSKDPKIQSVAEQVVKDPARSDELFKEMSRLATRQAVYVPVSLYDSVWYSTAKVQGLSWGYQRGYPLPTEWSFK